MEHIIIENHCRLTNYDSSYNSTEFNRLACSKCYDFLKFIFIDFHQAFYVNDYGMLNSHYDNQTNLDLSRDQDVSVLKQMMHSNEFNKWSTCCEEAKKCCSSVMSNVSLGNCCPDFIFLPKIEYTLILKMESQLK